jgi:hypothetical protein
LLDAQSTGQRRQHDLILGGRAVLDHRHRLVEHALTLYRIQMKVVHRQHDLAPGRGAAGRVSPTGPRYGPRLFRRPARTIDVEGIDGDGFPSGQDLEVLGGQVRDRRSRLVHDDDVEQKQSYRRRFGDTEFDRIISARFVRRARRRLVGTEGQPSRTAHDQGQRAADNAVHLRLNLRR